MGARYITWPPATAGSIRAARALTGREHVIATGYHGFHDWYIASTARNRGVPKFNQELIHSVPFNDLSALVGAPNVSIHEAKVFVCNV